MKLENEIRTRKFNFSCVRNYLDFYLGTIPLLAGGRRGSLSEVDGCGTGGGGGFLKETKNL